MVFFFFFLLTVVGVTHEPVITDHVVIRAPAACTNQRDIQKMIMSPTKIAHCARAKRGQNPTQGRCAGRKGKAICMAMCMAIVAGDACKCKRSVHSPSFP